MNAQQSKRLKILIIPVILMMLLVSWGLGWTRQIILRFDENITGVVDTNEWVLTTALDYDYVENIDFWTMKRNWGIGESTRAKAHPSSVSFFDVYYIAIGCFYANLSWVQLTTNLVKETWQNLPNSSYQFSVINPNSYTHYGVWNGIDYLHGEYNMSTFTLPESITNESVWCVQVQQAMNHRRLRIPHTALVEHSEGLMLTFLSSNGTILVVLQNWGMLIS
ncbi:MAG: hypothetical protein ACW976_05395 [Candidatus Ranarchaeia archaeon]|jgi:hypothetical protein